VEFRQLKYYEAVARTLNFSKAAEELHIAQPPLSRQIQNLEDDLGVLLIDRSTRPLKLTDAGAFMYEQAVQVMARMEEIKRSTKRIGNERKRWMGVGYVPSILYTPIPKRIQVFATSNKQIEVSLHELTSLEQCEALKSGRIDVGFGRLAIQDDAIANRILGDEPLVLAVSSNSVFAEQLIVSLKDLINETLILYPSAPRPSFADQVLRQFKVRGLEVHNTYETNGVQTAIGLVAAGMGVTLVPKSVKLLGRSDIHYLELSDAGLTSPLIMAFRKNDQSEHVSAFNSAIEAYFKEKEISP
jgi:DNA-binding transcriptional LysR family regulator